MITAITRVVERTSTRSLEVLRGGTLPLLYTKPIMYHVTHYVPARRDTVSCSVLPRGGDLRLSEI